MTEIQFRLSNGDEPHITFPEGSPPLNGRISRRGRVVVALPAPFSHLQIAEGERLGNAKWGEIRRACHALGATIRS